MKKDNFNALSYKVQMFVSEIDAPYHKVKEI